ncbi:MAG TPA: YraN family protein [Polyangiaceae bacterium]|nr:YraN family protein [Polyangiaceae bacterium]
MSKRSTRQLGATGARGHRLSPNRSPERERSRLGKAAEAAVADWLTVRGVRVLATNVRVSYLEVDILARDGRTLVLVEVRTRGPGSWTSGLGSVDHWKRVRLRRAGERLWQRKFKYQREFDHVRFDVASVSWDGDAIAVEYVKAAF